MTQLTAPRISLAEYKRNIHVAVVPRDVTLEQALEPVFWAHVAQNLKPWDRIELRAEDKSWYADCVVVDAGRLSATVKVVTKIDLDPAQVGDVPGPKDKSGFHVDYGGPIDLYRVVRDADSVVMTQGLSQTAANQWIKDHLEARARPAASAPVVATALSPEPETGVSRDAVVIPEKWGELPWSERRSLASKLTDKPVNNGQDAKAAIEGELQRRQKAA